jgi:hypothetical protein
MGSENTKLEKLLEQKGKIENRIKQIKAKENTQKQKIDTRKKILLGVIFDGLIAEGRIKDEVILDAVERHLKTNRDRELIGNYLANLSRAD